MSDHWILTYEEYLPDQEGLRETLCALGNGYFVSRGATPESPANHIHYPGTYRAGLYNRLITDVAGKEIPHEDLVNLPNWLYLTFRINGGTWFNLEAVEILQFQQSLNLKAGVLTRHIRFKDAQDHICTVEERRFVHMEHFHLAGLETTLTAENWSGHLEIKTALDGTVVNNGVKNYRYLNNKHLEAMESSVLDNGDILFLLMQTNQSKIQVAEAARTLIYRNHQQVDVARININHPAFSGQSCMVEVSQGDVVTVEKTMTLYTSKDNAISETGLEAINAIMRIPSFQDLLISQENAWKRLWQRFDIEIETSENDGAVYSTQLILRLHMFHLLQTASPNTIDLDVGIPARGWHGEAYRGHIFWDDLFIFPFINLRLPELTNSLLRYRKHRMPEARYAASQLNLAGVKFPWQSGSNGQEETPRFHLDVERQHWIPDRTYYQWHVNSAIAYNVWQYFQATNDIEFMENCGAVLILEIARFWSSAAEYNPDRDRYEIRGLMGPDEYHNAYPGSSQIGLNNNAYTNMMAAWTLCRALDLVEILPTDALQQICDEITVPPEEIQRWKDISLKMYVPIQESGIISQFEGYEHLEEFPWRHNGEQLIDRDKLKEVLIETDGTPNRYKVSKQADVLMLFYLFSSEELKSLFDRLGYPFYYETIPKNIDYYLSRTAHGSSLSRVVHSWVASRSNRPRSWELLVKALEHDMLDLHGSTPEGIHLGAMAGTVDIFQRNYTGMVTRDGILWLNPQLPDPLQRMQFSIHYRHQSLELDITHQRLKISVHPSKGASIQLGVYDRVYEICAGDVMEFPVKRPSVAQQT